MHWGLTIAACIFVVLLCAVPWLLRKVGDPDSEKGAAEENHDRPWERF